MCAGFRAASTLDADDSGRCSLVALAQVLIIVSLHVAVPAGAITSSPSVGIASCDCTTFQAQAFQKKYLVSAHSGFGCRPITGGEREEKKILQVLKKCDFCAGLQMLE